MKVLQITFVFFALAFSGTEEKVEDVYFACQPESSSYCSGYADGMEAGGADPEDWRSNYNGCVKKRGCDQLILPPPGQE
ncbi:hypothetical protein HNV08_00675 [Winogradskyella eckloniae]|uniref:hypothetical protein n=1 Tax=Winogradskyella eckloniae TaxID=1089306 RepID=UPI00156406C9|nr:hypothetical protein [Winogradskyella eckloniae]NRD18544.1 hypothetical protein [Winogradskyella eckloniae]